MGSGLIQLWYTTQLEAISLYSDIDSCSFTTPSGQLTCKALYTTCTASIGMYAYQLQ